MTRNQEALIAVIQTELKYMKDAIDALSHTSKERDLRLEKIENILREAKGGWRLLIVIGTAAAAIGATSSKIFAWLFSFPFPK